MGTDVECPHWRKGSHYNSDEIDNIGTILKPQLVVICHHCGKKIISPEWDILQKK